MSSIVPVDLTGPAGRLESILKLPDRPPRMTAVVAHPHPLYGGTPHNRVVYGAPPPRAARARPSTQGGVLRPPPPPPGPGRRGAALQLPRRRREPGSPRSG